MNSRQKGKVGEREFAALLREQGFDARRGQQFAGGTDSPDVVSAALDFLHIEVKRVQHLKLADACAQARRDAGGKPWIVAHRKNREPWFVTLDSEFFFELLREFQPRMDRDKHGCTSPQPSPQSGEGDGAHGVTRPTEATDAQQRVLLRESLSPFGLWPFSGPRAITLDAELFFQFLREIQRKRYTDETGYVVTPDQATRINTPDLAFRGGAHGVTRPTEGTDAQQRVPTTTISDLVLADGQGADARTAQRSVPTTTISGSHEATPGQQQITNKSAFEDEDEDEDEDENEDENEDDRKPRKNKTYEDRKSQLPL